MALLLPESPFSDVTVLNSHGFKISGWSGNPRILLFLEASMGGLVVVKSLKHGRWTTHCWLTNMLSNEAP
jgi:hypothetical protein